MSLAMCAAPFDNDKNGSDEINNMGSISSGGSNGSGGGGSGANTAAAGVYRTRMTQSHNKTQKRTPPTEKALSVIQSMHNLPQSSSELADFSPLPPPSSAGVESTILRDQGIALKNRVSSSSSSSPPSLSSSQSTMNHNPHSNVSSNMRSNQYSNLDGYGDNTEEGFENHDLMVGVAGRASPHHSHIPDEFYNNHIPNYEEMYKRSGIKPPTAASHSQHRGGSMSNINTYNRNFDTDNNNNTHSSNSMLVDKLNYMIHLLEENQDERTNNVTEEVILYSFLGIFIIFIVDSFTRVGKYTR